MTSLDIIFLNWVKNTVQLSNRPLNDIFKLRKNVILNCCDAFWLHFKRFDFETHRLMTSLTIGEIGMYYMIIS